MRFGLIICVCFFTSRFERGYWTPYSSEHTKSQPRLLPANIKSDSFFSLHNVDYGAANKNAEFYSFGTFLGPKRLKNDEK